MSLEQDNYGLIRAGEQKAFGEVIKICEKYERMYSDPNLLDAEGWNGGMFNGKRDMANRIRLEIELKLESYVQPGSDE